MGLQVVDVRDRKRGRLNLGCKEIFPGVSTGAGKLLGSGFRDRKVGSDRLLSFQASLSRQNLITANFLARIIFPSESWNTYDGRRCMQAFSIDHHSCDEMDGRISAGGGRSCLHRR
jgi:hypothetical protein